MIIDPYTWHTVRILRIIREAPDAVTILTTKPDTYSFLPGQHAIVRTTLADGTKRLRQYSYADSPDSDSLRFTITRSPGGEVSSWFIDECKTGATIDISQPFRGPLQTPIDDYRHIGMIAAGSGIAPMLSYLYDMRQHKSTTERTLIYTTRSTTRCAKRVLENSQPSEHIVLQISDINGRLSTTEIVQALAQCDLILICGSRQFVMHIKDLCAKNLPTAAIRAEAFSLK